jgi:Tfp pilus assembly protein PilO
VQVKTKNLVMGALVVLFVGLLWFQFVYSPMENKASKARTAAHDADQSAAQLRRALAEGTTKKPKSQDATSQAMLEAVPVDEAEAQFLRDVDALRVQTGAAWQSITPTAGAAGAVGSTNLTTVNVGITVQGTNAQLLQYVTGLSGLKRLFVADNINLTANGSKGAPTAGGAAPATDQMQLQVTGRIFSQAAGTAVPTGAAGSTPSAAPAQAGTQTG